MRLLLVTLAAALAGCTTSYTLTLMPRNSGQVYYGEAVSPSGGETQLTVAIGERTYKGNWVIAQPPPSTGFSVGGFFGGHRGGSMGTSVIIDQQAGSEAKALLRADDGSGLRCDLKGAHTGSGSGTCQDDNGLVYDVQIRSK